jgi:hypothetical protein
VISAGRRRLQQNGKIKQGFAPACLSARSRLGNHIRRFETSFLSIHYYVGHPQSIRYLLD